MTDDSNILELRPANSMLGFASVSLRVPSSDPLPSDDAWLRAPANMDRPPGRSHAYHTLEPPGESGREQVVAGLNPDNRTNLREIIHPFTCLPRDVGRDVSFAINQKQHQHAGDMGLPQQTKLTAVNSSLPPIPGSGQAAKGGYEIPVDAEKGLEGSHKYDDVELIDDEASREKPIEINSKEHGYDVLDGDQTTPTRFTVEKTTGKNISRDHHAYDVLDVEQTSTSRFVIETPAEKREHAYDVLDSDQTTKFVIKREAGYSSSTHVLVSPKPKTDQQGLKSEVRNFAISNNSLQQSSVGARSSPPCDDIISSTDICSGSNPSTGYKLWGFNQQQPRRTTHSSASRAALSPAKPVFDDPMYDAAFDGSLSMGPPQGNITTSLIPPPTHPRTRSLMQTHRNMQTYELTENFLDTVTLEAMQSDTTSSLPTPKPQPTVYSHDRNESTNLFDDPEYAVGLNWKK